ncbi:MAG: hypothetical protein BWY80_01060 [Firmicutes bacterium ADurb.Bin456]|nr:MAG: hypothetical protein BWY80_01060 [Firmicutes bacterium ADurb.Bin456]
MFRRGGQPPGGSPVPREYLVRRQHRVLSGGKQQGGGPVPGGNLVRRRPVTIIMKKHGSDVPAQLFSGTGTGAVGEVTGVNLNNVLLSVPGIVDQGVNPRSEGPGVFHSALPVKFPSLFLQYRVQVTGYPGGFGPLVKKTIPAHVR